MWMAKQVAQWGSSDTSECYSWEDEVDRYVDFVLFASLFANNFQRSANDKRKSLREFLVFLFGWFLIAAETSQSDENSATNEKR